MGHNDLKENVCMATEDWNVAYAARNKADGICKKAKFDRENLHAGYVNRYVLQGTGYIRGASIAEIDTLLCKADDDLATACANKIKTDEDWDEASNNRAKAYDEKLKADGMQRQTHALALMHYAEEEDPEFKEEGVKEDTEAAF